MKAYELLKNNSAWCQHALAKTKTGKRTSPHSKTATSWCLMGAVEKCYGRAYSLHKEAALEAIRNHLGIWDCAMWNDEPHRTFKEVRALLKKVNV